MRLPTETELKIILVVLMLPSALIGVLSLLRWPIEFLKSVKWLFVNGIERTSKRFFTALIITLPTVAVFLINDRNLHDPIQSLAVVDLIMLWQFIILRSWQWVQGYSVLPKFLSARPRLSSADFYASPEWLDLRYRALRDYGRECMLCRRRDGEMHVDHIKPRSKYPRLELKYSNLQILCRECNLGNSNRYMDDFRKSESV